MIDLDLDAVTPLLLEALPRHLAQQRWAGVHEQSIAAVTARWWEVVCTDDDVALLWSLIEVAHGEDRLTYQLFIGVRAAADPPEFLHGKEREVIGLLSVAAGDLLAYDALVDPDLAVAVLHLVDPDIHVEVRRPLVLEHSNSSVVFDEARILKVFRRIEEGPNPDVAITRELAKRGSPHVLAPLAELHRDGTDLAVLREFLVGATEGWALAGTSVRDVLASRLAPEEAGGDLAHDMERLGVVLGELHGDMAAIWGDHPGDAPGWIAQMDEQLASAADTGAAHLPPGVDTSEISARYRSLATLADPGRQIRIHGDLHLAQVLRVDDGWRVLDFEGEPARRRDDRFTTSSPLRDVAGILRSLHYAATTQLADWDTDDGELAELAGAWEARNRDAFLRGYLSVEAATALLPADAAARDAVLGAFELDKAVYELAYELAYRPEQAFIPAEGIARLLKQLPA